MVFINIPFVHENKNIDTDVVAKELAALNISEDAKYEIFQAIFNMKPRGVEFEDKDLKEVKLLENILAKLGIPYRESEVSEFS
ncbi:hypothetical protein BH20ACI1_BH20ACI1_05370 [soil metagenome]